MTTSPAAARGAAQAASALEALAALSRLLVDNNQGGLLAEALDLALVGAGCARGAAYAIGDDTLELVAEHGLPAALRASLERLPLTGAPHHAVQRAVHARKLVMDPPGPANDGPEHAALAAAGWDHVVACPIAAGREVHGVLALAWPRAEPPEPAERAFLDTVCGLMALRLARRAEEHRRRESPAIDTQSARLSVLGTLATSLAERLDAQVMELGRRLAEQHGKITGLRGRHPESDPELEGIGRSHAKSRQAVAAIRRTSQRFLAAVRPSAPERLDLGHLARDALALVTPLLHGQRIDVELRAAGAHPVVGRRSELIQLFVHLLLDLTGAHPDPGESDPEGMIPCSYALQLLRLGEREIVCLTDAGEDAGGARASFFKEGARGRGLDLSMVRQIARAHEGHVEIGASSANLGARCTVVLPAAHPDVEAPRPASAGPVERAARPVVLWVDDDELFLEIMAQSFPDCDLRVAESTAQAAQILSFGLEPAIVFCSVELADRGGHELHAELAAHEPRIADRFVFVCDGALTPAIAGYVARSGRPTLERPIDLERVRALLDGVSARVEPRPARHASAGAPTVPALAAVRPPDPPPERPSTPPAARPTTLPPAPRTTTVEMAAAAESRLSPPHLEPAEPAPRSPVPASTREQELGTIARAAAEILRREGPKRSAAVIAALRGRGLTEADALSAITFALATGAVVRDPPMSSSLRAPDLRQSNKVLVVDDDHDLRVTLREILQDEGYEVETAANGREALKLLRDGTTPPPILVLDLMMPVMDGWQLLNELEHDEALAGLRVVVISASKTGLRSVQAQEFLSKPLDYHRLLSTIERSARGRAALQ